MKRVAVSGIGALIGHGIVKSIRLCDESIYILGLDASSVAVGQYECDSFEIVPFVIDPTYNDDLKCVLQRHDIDLFFPGIPQDIRNLYNNFDTLNTFYPEIVINTYDMLDLSSDKWKTYIRLQEAGFPTIPTSLSKNFNYLSHTFGLPFLLKSATSEASKNIYRIYTREDFDYYSKKANNDFMAQKIVGRDSEEYTIGVFGLGDGTTNGMISFKRRLNYDGWTKEAIVFHDDALEETVRKLVELLRPVGPTNFQFRFENGEYLLLEINARFSSSNSIRTAFGYNEAEMCIDFYLNKQAPKKYTIKDGYAVRYIEDFVVRK